MASLSTLFIYWSLIFALLVVLSTTGLALSYLISSRDQFQGRHIPGNISVIGLCYLIIASLALANVFGEIDRFFLIGILILPVLSALFKFVRNELGQKKRCNSGDLRRSVISTLIPLAAYSVIGMIPFYSFLNQYVSRSFVLTSATKFNGDIGMYLQMSSNLISHGFNDNGKVVGANVGALARFDHPGAQAALAGKSQILGLFPHQMGVIVAACLLAMLGLCVHQILSSDQRPNDRWLYLLGIWTVVNPLVTEMSNQFFYAQLLTAVMMLGLLSLCQRFLIYHQTRNFPFIFLLGVSGFVTSPEVAVMLMAIFFLPVCHVYFSKRPASMKFRPNRQTVLPAVFILSILVVGYPFVVEEIQVLTRTTQEGIAGWSSSVLSPIGWMGLTPGTYLFVSTALENLLGIIIVVVIVRLALRLLLHRKDANATLLVAIFLIALMILIAMALIYGNTEYQTWKTAISITPLLIVGLFAILNSFDKTKKNIYLVVSLIIGAGLASSSLNWMGLKSTNYVNQSLIAITQSMEYRRITQIDVDLTPKLETMFAVPLLKGEVNLVSPSYFNLGRNDRKFPCLLTSEAKARRLGLLKNVIVERGKYVIVGDSNC